MVSPFIIACEVVIVACVGINFVNIRRIYGAYRKAHSPASSGAADGTNPPAGGGTPNASGAVTITTQPVQVPVAYRFSTPAGGVSHYVTATVWGVSMAGGASFGGTGGGGLGYPDISKIENAGIKLGEIIGWRCWLLEENNMLVRSVYMMKFWAPKEPMEGDVSCEGVHAWKTHALALEYGLPQGQPAIVGQVALWGDVIEHDSGYRAQFAKVYSFETALNCDAKVLPLLRKKYGLEAP